MTHCANCGFKLQHHELEARCLVVCCDFSLRMCSTCLLDFYCEQRDRIVHQCVRCSRQIRIKHLKLRYQMFSKMGQNSSEREEDERGFGGQNSRDTICGGHQQQEIRMPTNTLQSQPKPQQTIAVKRQLQPQEPNLVTDRLVNLVNQPINEASLRDLVSEITYMIISGKKKEQHMGLEEVVEVMRRGGQNSRDNILRSQTSPQQGDQSPPLTSEKEGNTQGHKRSLSSNVKALNSTPLHKRPTSSHCRKDTIVDNKEEEFLPCFGKKNPNSTD